MNREDKSYEQLASLLCEEFHKKQSAGLLANLEKRNIEALDVSREKILMEIRQELSGYQNENGEELTEEEKNFVMDLIRKELWGYGIIDGLIHQPDISDIKLYGPDNIRVKTSGKRSGSGICFSDKNYYNRFVTKILERNKVNLGTANAIQTFTDAGQDDFILRITIISGLLTDSGLPVVACSGSCLEEAGGPDSLYVAPGDVAGMGVALCRVLKGADGREERIRRSKEYVTRFENTGVARQMLQVYERLLKEQS